MTEGVLIGFPMGECNLIAAGIFTSNYPHRKIYLNVLEITLVIPFVVLFCKDPYRNHEINTCSFLSLLLILEVCLRARSKYIDWVCKKVIVSLGLNSIINLRFASPYSQSTILKPQQWSELQKFFKPKAYDIGDYNDIKEIL
ncbi:hypothetical protein BDF21DRAFT_453146 [Thamnidium elegans]|nr:hypothetical protein BDF21DRAFT_453146 [Thamnidium elegans]